MDNLDDFLQAHRDEGRPTDIGAFTINAARALELVGVQSQPFPEAWVLKLVQAACSENCASLLVTQDSSSTTLTFLEATWTWDQIRQALGRVAEGRCSSLDHLAKALLWLAKGTQHLFTLRLADGNLVSWDGAEFLVEESEANQVRLRLDHANGDVKAPFWKRRSRAGVGVTAAIATMLHHRASTSSVPLYLDSRHLAGLHHIRRDTGSLKLRPLALLTSPPSQALPSFAMSLTHEWEKMESGPEIHLRGPLPRDGGSHGIVTLLSAYLKKRKVGRGIAQTQTRSVAGLGKSYLVWVLDGVVIAEEALKVEAPLGFVTAVSAAGLRTDLSGFGLIQNEELKVRRRAALRTLREQLAEIYLHSDTHIDVALQGRTFMTVQVASAAIGLLVYFPVGVFLAVNAYQVFKDEAEHEKEMEKIYRLGLAKLRDGVAALLIDR